MFFIFFLSCSNSTGDKPQDKEEEWIDAYEMNKRLNRGINLGNALEAPNEGDWGVVLKAEYFNIIKAAGFSAVRIPVRWSAHAQSDSPYTIDWAFMSRVDWAVAQARSNDLIAIVNIHHYEEIFVNPAAHKKRFLALWKQIAEHYKNQTQYLLFEILNEPHDQLTPDLWNEYLKEALEIIRESNPERIVIVATANWGGIDAIEKLQLPDDPRLIVTFHYYQPFHFTHQGAGWVQGSDAWLGTTWNGTASEKKAIQNDFDRVKNWSVAHNRPIFMGEFGAYSKADMDSRVRWTYFVAREAEKHGFSWAYWEFCSGFGAYDPVQNKWRPELLNALIP
ncbi:MAG: glycoside hydrolase family 5 protein [Calditrichaeota bacterium]|nr:glycoside hydrolase family 5 protein [Calditrichota bacterium]